VGGGGGGGGGLDWGQSLWAIFGKKAQYLYKKIRYCFPEHNILSWPVHMIFIWTLDQRNRLLFALRAGVSESPSGCQNNVTINTTVPKGIERHFHPAYCGAVLGPWTFWLTRK